MSSVNRSAAPSSARAEAPVEASVEASKTQASPTSAPKRDDLGDRFDVVQGSSNGKPTRPPREEKPLTRNTDSSANFERLMEVRRAGTQTDAWFERNKMRLEQLAETMGLPDAISTTNLPPEAVLKIVAVAEATGAPQAVLHDPRFWHSVTVDRDSLPALEPGEHVDPSEGIFGRFVNESIKDGSKALLLASTGISGEKALIEQLTGQPAPKDFSFAKYDISMGGQLLTPPAGTTVVIPGEQPGTEGGEPKHGTPSDDEWAAVVQAAGGGSNTGQAFIDLKSLPGSDAEGGGGMPEGGGGMPEGGGGSSSPPGNAIGTQQGASGPAAPGGGSNPAGSDGTTGPSNGGDEDTSFGPPAVTSITWNNVDANDDGSGTAQVTNHYSDGSSQQFTITVDASGKATATDGDGNVVATGTGHLSESLEGTTTQAHNNEDNTKTDSYEPPPASDDEGVDAGDEEETDAGEDEETPNPMADPVRRGSRAEARAIVTQQAQTTRRQVSTPSEGRQPAGRTSVDRFVAAQANIGRRVATAGQPGEQAMPSVVGGAIPSRTVNGKPAGPDEGRAGGGDGTAGPGQPRTGGSGGPGDPEGGDPRKA